MNAGFLPSLLALAAVLLANCGPQRVQTVGLQASDLPPSLPMPQLSGNAEEVFKQLCDWQADHQIPFTPELVERVYVSRIQSLGATGAAESMLQDFLGGRSAPQTIVLSLDPSSLHFTPVLERFSRLIDQAGLWLVTRRTGGTCAANEADATLEGRSCVSAFLLTAPPDDWVEADYRDLTFRVGVATGAGQKPQLLHVNVLTLYRGEQVVGRTIDSTANRGPLEVGTVAGVCARIAAIEFDGAVEP